MKTLNEKCIPDLCGCIIPVGVNIFRQDPDLGGGGAEVRDNNEREAASQCSLNWGLLRSFCMMCF